MDETHSLAGKFLIAMPGMGDQRFEKSVIFICVHSSEGAMGFIVNQTLADPNVLDFFARLEIITEEEKINFSSEFGDRKLNMGGPVEPGRGFVLHSPDYKNDSSLAIDDDVSLTATLEILRAIATGKGPEKSILALGYSGWGAGQLEEEIAANGWLICDADYDILFDENHETKYQRVYEILGINPLLLSSDAGHA